MTIPHCHGKRVKPRLLLWFQPKHSTVFWAHPKTVTTPNMIKWELWREGSCEFWTGVITKSYWGLYKHAFPLSPPSPLHLLWVNHTLTILSPPIKPSPPLWGESWRGAASALFTLDLDFLRFGTTLIFEGYSELWNSSKAFITRPLWDGKKAEHAVAGW